MNISFEKELPIVTRKYPHLKLKNTDGTNYLKGILDISDKEGIILGDFSVEIHPTEKFPHQFPKLFEVGGDIPCEQDWHKYSDGSCCLTVEQEEIILCKNGITLINFIENIAVPYFANQLYRKQEGVYLNEYPHGLAGIKLFYTELFKSDKITLWIKCCESAFIKRNIGRNDKCYCGSMQKFKKCHLSTEEKLQILGKEKVLTDIKQL